MKHVRSLLFLLVAGLMLSSTALAQGDISLGGGGGGDLSAGIVKGAFSGSSDVVVRLWHPYNTDLDSTATHAKDTVVTVSARSKKVRAFKFSIVNGESTQDTLEQVSLRSFNDKPYTFKNVYLYRSFTGTDTVGTKIAEVLDLGALDDYNENEALAFTGLHDTIPANDTVWYWFSVDIDSARIDTLYNDKYAGFKIFQNGIKLAQGGYCPTGATDTLRYSGSASVHPHTVEGTYNGDGRPLVFDTKPPELTINFTIADDADICSGNGIVNLGDSIFVFAIDTVGAFDIYKAYVYLQVFGAGASAKTMDDTLAGYPAAGDSSITYGWRIPETPPITPVLDVPSGFYYLVMKAEDRAGNQKTDSLLVNYAIDNQKPVFDGDSVWVSLKYDANGDGIAAINDSIKIFAYMTSNDYGEVTSVVADMSNWGYGSVTLEDQSGDRRFAKTIKLTTGALDIVADSTGSRFWVTAIDNACNWKIDSNVAHFAVDNQPPVAPVTFTYTRYLDKDSNNVVNVGDQVRFTIDATNTLDLTATCEVMLDLMNSGLGGSQTQCVEDTITGGAYRYTYTVAPGGIWAVDVAASTHTVEVTLTDDAGNTETYTSDAIIFPVDTDPPLAATNLTPSLGPCSIILDWKASNVDDSLYLVYWDGGDGVWSTTDTTVAVGSSTDTTWTTDGTVTLEHGKTYQFVVRTIDDADNREWNFTRVSQVADCEAPTVCINYPSTGGAYGILAPLTVVAESSFPDIAGATLYVRDADQGTGTPGPWISLGAMTQVGGGQQFTKTVNNTMMLAAFPGSTADDLYQFITVGVDDVGNVQTTDDADAACADFGFTWFYQGLPVVLIEVNDTVSPQTSCGYNVTRDNDNTVDLTVTGHVTGRTYTVDVIYHDTTTATLSDWRVGYYENVGTMPYTFNFDATRFAKGSDSIFVKVTRDDGNIGWLGFQICVPDVDAPDAAIYYPVDGQRVRRMNTGMNPLEVWAKVTNWAYDPSPVARVDFEHSTDYSTGYAVFDVETALSGGYYKATWDNRAFADGETVYLRAKFYDDKNNFMYTPVVTVYMDSSATDIMLTCPQAASINGVVNVAGTVDFYAEIQETYNDFSNLYFYYKKSTDPDVGAYWTLVGAMQPATDEGVYVRYNFSTTGLTDNVNYDFRVIAEDITGNVMWDYDGDGQFDDNTFDPATKNSDRTFRIDNSPAQIAINEAVASGITFYTPSTKLSGAGHIYVQKGDAITLHSQTIPMADSFEVTDVMYIWKDANDSVTVGTAAPVPPYEVTFNPYTLGLYTDGDIDNNYFNATIYAAKEDSLNRPTQLDTISVTVLDIEPNKAMITNLDWMGYYWGDIPLEAAALNAYQLRKVVYFYRASGQTEWIPIDSSATSPFAVTFPTLNFITTDGLYELAAVAVDSAFNRDDNPYVWKIYVANSLPTASLTTPADSAIIGPGEVFKATASSGIVPIYSVEFQVKPILSGTWETWETDYFSPWEAMWLGYAPDKISVDGPYHFRVVVTNFADRVFATAPKTLYNDQTDPLVTGTRIAGQDVEANNDPALDLTGLSEITVEGAFYDDQSWSGVNSGIAKIAFEVRDSNGNAVRYFLVDPATDGVHSVKFNVAALPEGTYDFYYYAWDNVGNADTLGPVHGYITDQEAPYTSVIGYYNHKLYGYDWSGDVTKVLFQYQTGSEWIGVGTGTTVSGASGYWWTEFDPSSVPAGAHNFRMLASDASDNYNEEFAYVISGTASATTVVFANPGNIGVSTLKDRSGRENFNGFVNADAGATGTPVVLAIDGTCSSTTYSDLDLEPVLGSTSLYRGSFDGCGDAEYGRIYFLIGAETGTSAAFTSVTTYHYWEDFGTNGTVYGNIHGTDTLVSVSIPADAGHGNLVIMEGWLPTSGEGQDNWRPIGNGQISYTYALANFIGCTDGEYSAPLADKPGAGDQLSSSGGYGEGCYFDDNVYARITMKYDPTVTTPAESLVVVRWSDYHNMWKTSGITYLSGDGGFDVAHHTVTFHTECLYGYFAVVRLGDLSPVGPISMSFREAYPWCSGVTGPYQEGVQPKFQFNIKDDFSGIDDGTFEITLDGTTIHSQGSDADYWTTYYDDVSQVLKIWMIDEFWYDDYDYTYDYEYAPPLGCGNHALTISVKNNQGNLGTLTWPFTVDCTDPVVVFENSYVSKNPTIEFTISDDSAGIDWDHVWVDVIAWSTTDTNAAHPYQEDIPLFYQSFTGDQVRHYLQEDNTTVQITTHFELEDERFLTIAIYDGSTSSFEDPPGAYYYNDWDRYWLEQDGVLDCVGNQAQPWIQILAIDYDGPVILADGETLANMFDALPDVCPVSISIADDGSGVERVEVYENDVLITAETGDLEAGHYKYSGGRLLYCKTPGVRTRIIAYDNVGNMRERTWAAFGPGDYSDTGDPYNYPNPFNLAENDFTTIVTGFDGNEISVKIYDFAGELVISGVATNGEYKWYGITDGGKPVATGVYFAYCQASDGKHKIVKIAVIDK